MLRIAAVMLSAFFFLSSNGLDSAIAAPSYVGPEKCQNCHKAPYEVWKGTKHFSSYKKIHKHKTAKKILKAVGEKRMKKSAVCATCHYTVVEKKGNDIVRILPRVNDQVNEEWLTDKGRYSFDSLSTNRLDVPLRKEVDFLMKS